jgi:hypothetical protein
LLSSKTNKTKIRETFAILIVYRNQGIQHSTTKCPANAILKGGENTSSNYYAKNLWMSNRGQISMTFNLDFSNVKSQPYKSKNSVKIKTTGKKTQAKGL